MPGERARKAVSRTSRKAERQARGTYRNTRETVGSFTLDQVLPSGIAGFIQEVLSLVPKALGRGTAKQQIFASITMILIAIVTTPFTLGWSLVLAAPFVITLLIGAWRHVPAVNAGFGRLRGNKLRDRDVPLWKRD